MKGNLPDSFESIAIRLTRWSLVLLAFLIPFHGKIPIPALYLSGLLWLLELVVSSARKKNFRFIIDRFTSHGNLWLRLSFFLLILIYAAGMLWSGNIADCRFELEKKALLLLFPLVFFSMNPHVFSLGFLKKIYRSFSFGLLAVTLSDFIFAMVRYHAGGDPAEFYYSKLAMNQHPSYLSLYACFALGISLNSLVISHDIRSRFLRVAEWMLAGWWVLMVVLLSSRAGFISLIITMIYFLFVILKRLNTKAVWMSAGGLLLLMAVTLAVPGTRIRYLSAFKMFSGESHYDATHKADGIMIRKLSWDLALEKWGENPVLGTGTGDYWNETRQQIEQNDLVFVFGGYKNAHNQYLQTSVTLGIVGLAALLMWIFIPVFSATYCRSFLYMLLFWLVLFNLIPESMLETQAGVLFIAFFYSCIFVCKEEAKKRPATHAAGII
jgi:O-antigen ligase